MWNALATRFVSDAIETEGIVKEGCADFKKLLVTLTTFTFAPATVSDYNVAVAGVKSGVSSAQAQKSQ